MRPRHPRLWLMTDERQGDALWDAIARLPRGSGIVFRHYTLAPGQRRALFERVRRAARRRGLTLMLAGDPRTARAWRADGFHGPAPKRPGDRLRSAAVHDRRQMIAAIRGGADLLFVSPVFATRSHPGARQLGRVRLGLLIRGAKARIVALGGIDAKRARSLEALGIDGWAAIDGLTPGPVRT